MLGLPFIKRIGYCQTDHRSDEYVSVKVICVVGGVVRLVLSNPSSKRLTAFAVLCGVEFLIRNSSRNEIVLSITSACLTSRIYRASYILSVFCGYFIRFSADNLSQ